MLSRSKLVTPGSSLAPQPYVRQVANFSNDIYVQQPWSTAGGVDSGNGTGFFTPFASDVLSGSTIFVICTWPNDGGTLPGLTTFYVRDNQAYSSTNYPQLGSQVDDFTGGQSMGLYCIQNVGVGAYTVALENSNVYAIGLQYIGVVAFEIANAAAASLDGYNCSALLVTGTGTNAIDLSVTNTVNAKALLVGMSENTTGNNSPYYPAPGTGFTDEGIMWEFGPSTFYGRAEAINIASVGAQQCLWTPPGTDTYLTGAAVFHG